MNCDIYSSIWNPIDPSERERERELLEVPPFIQVISIKGRNVLLLRRLKINWINANQVN